MTIHRFKGLHLFGCECQPDNNGKCPANASTVIYRSFLNFDFPSEIWDSGFVDAQGICGEF
jgi:hypothetical protein